MNIVVFLIVGLVAGWLASALMRGAGVRLNRRYSYRGDRSFSGRVPPGSSRHIFPRGIVGFIIQSFIGAVVLLIIIKGRSDTPSPPLLLNSRGNGTT